MAYSLGLISDIRGSLLKYWLCGWKFGIRWQTGKCRPVELLCRASRAFFLTHWAVMRPRFICISSKQLRTLKGRSALALLRNQSVAACKRHSTSLIVLVCFVYGWTVPLNHILLIPVEQTSVHVLPLLEDLSKCSAAELSDPPCCLHGTCFPSFLCDFFFVPPMFSLCLSFFISYSLFLLFLARTSRCLPLYPFPSFLICF